MKEIPTRLLAMIELHAPSYICDDPIVQRLEHTACCAYCHGQGEIATWDSQYDNTSCPLCKGSGRMTASVSITWRAANKQPQA